jgi:hypothetical protein
MTVINQNGQRVEHDSRGTWNATVHEYIAGWATARRRTS